jgi:hypothetical protein
VTITAVFNADLSYQVDALTEGGDAYTFIGTFVADGSTSPRGIVLDQSSPSETVAEGIYEVSGETLTYEVVVTTPDYGFVAPTPATGFGSTSGRGLAEGDNVQTYVRQ